MAGAALRGGVAAGDGVGEDGLAEAGGAEEGLLGPAVGDLDLLDLGAEVDVEGEAGEVDFAVEVPVGELEGGVGARLVDEVVVGEGGEAEAEVAHWSVPRAKVKT